MPRQARVVVPGCPHHVTQRGNRRQQTFFRDADYLTYLQIAAEAFAEAQVEVWAYCLMPNHVHLIATPRTPEGLARAVGTTHLRYTRHINSRERWRGYLWQGRFASFAMDEDYLRTCVRYAGLNPVRAGLTARAEAWAWSSVRAHLTGRSDLLLTPGPVFERYGPELESLFACDVSEEARRKLARASATGRPLGAGDWVKALEKSFGRVLSDPPRGRPRLESTGAGHARFSP